jgi:hypothetical protein
MGGDLIYPPQNYPQYPTANSMQPYYYPRPTPYLQQFLPLPPGLGFSPYPYPIANGFYPYTPPPAPAPVPAPALSDRKGFRQQGKRQGKKGHNLPKEKTEDGHPQHQTPSHFSHAPVQGFGEGASEDDMMGGDLILSSPNLPSIRHRQLHATLLPSTTTPPSTILTPPWPWLLTLPQPHGQWFHSIPTLPGPSPCPFRQERF